MPPTNGPPSGLMRLFAKYSPPPSPPAAPPPLPLAPLMDALKSVLYQKQPPPWNGELKRLFKTNHYFPPPPHNPPPPPPDFIPSTQRLHNLLAQAALVAVEAKVRRLPPGFDAAGGGCRARSQACRYGVSPECAAQACRPGVPPGCAAWVCRPGALPRCAARACRPGASGPAEPARRTGAEQHYYTGEPYLSGSLSPNLRGALLCQGTLVRRGALVCRGTLAQQRESLPCLAERTALRSRRRPNVP
eukprot:244102-Prorocentrum_minimum.AAC.1